MTEFTVYGQRESTGNEFSAPVEARSEEEAERKFLVQVDKPSDFDVERVE